MKPNGIEADCTRQIARARVEQKKIRQMYIGQLGFMLRTI